ncbi:MAG: exonuclease domain-containing protein [Chloroflexaceae bacterium]|jgi:DNA polymerase-3 subunit epsilon|nr:exonuclease domain-containing protein [Chloroflexaceae bacterium]
MSPSAQNQFEHMVGQPVQRLPLVFVDLETTGLFPGQGHRVCEVGLLRVEHTHETSFSSLVQPERELESRAAAINGITPEMLTNAPRFAAVANEVLALLRGGVLVAHNAPFDVGFLEAELRYLGLPPPAMPVLDTLVLARRLLQRPSYSLRALSAEFGLHPPTHRAMADVLALRGLFAQLLALLAARQIENLSDVLRFQRGLLPGQPEPEGPPLINQAILEGRLLRIVYLSRSSPVPLERVIRPYELTAESSGIYLRAFCYLRNDIRSFALTKIELIELVGA